MTQEEKELLLKDLGARLTYGVKVQTDSTPRKMIAMDLWDMNSLPKPYLRPGSDATIEEINTSDKLFMENKYVEAIDYLLSRHIDIYDLISIGLALKASKEMYKF